MKTITTIAFLCFSLLTFAQVGVGNTDPKASLDISASNTTTPTNEDGILIPRIANFPTTDPGADQDGMMVFYTGTALSGKGFYYWDNGTGNWVSIQTVVNSLLEGNDTDINSNQIDIEPVLDNVHTINSPNPDFLVTVPNSNSRVQMSVAGNQFFNVGPRITENIGIGVNNGADNADRGLYNTFIGYNAGQNTTSTTGNTAQGSFNQAIGGFALSSNTTGVSNVAIGYNALRDNVTSNSSIAIGTQALSSSTAANNIAIGVSAGFSTTTGSNNIFLGRTAGFNETGSHKLYIENSNANADNALIYGEFDNDILRTNGQLQIGNPSTTGYALPETDGANGQVLITDGAGSITFQNITGDGDTQNTLDQAYDEGGNGVGKDITADNGAVRINGSDGILITGTLGSGNTIDDEITGDGVRMFFNPHKAAYRGGMAENDWWIDSRIGNYSFSHGRQTWVAGEYSVAFGRETSANGDHAFSGGFDSDAGGDRSFAYGLNSQSAGDYGVAFGDGVQANGDYSFAQGDSAISNNDFSFTSGQYNYVYADHAKAIGQNLNAESYGEIVLGMYDTNYTENSSTAFDLNDRLFVLGNGTSNTLRSNALTIYKNGLMNINDEYNMPLTDGTNGQVMTTDGAGNITFQDASQDADWHEVGTTSGANNINDNIFTQGNVGIGSTTPNASLDISYSGTQTNGISLDYTQTSASNSYGQRITAETTSTGFITGLQTILQNSNSSSLTTATSVANNANGDENVGISTVVNGNGDNNTGISTVVSGASDENIGGYFSVTSGGIINTGIFATASGGGTNWAGYFGNNAGNGNVYVNDLLEVASAFRYTDGNETLGYILSSNANGDASWVDPSSVFTNTDNQNLTAASLTGTTLNLGIQNGTGTSIDLGVLQDGTGSDNQNIENLSLNGSNILTVDIENGTADTVDLSTLDQSGDVASNLTTITNNTTNINANTTAINNHIANDADTVIGNEVITAATLNGTDLEITEAGSTTTVDLSSLNDSGTDNQNIQNLSLNASNILTVGIEDGGSDTVNLSSLDQSTEVSTNATAIANHIANDVDTVIGNEVITTATLNGTDLEITEAGSLTTVDLSLLQDGTGNDWNLAGNAGTNPSTDFIGTTDNESLSFRTNNTEKLRLTTKGQLEYYNTGRSVFIGYNAGSNDDLSDNENVFIGELAGQANTSGSSNTFVGYRTGLGNQTGLNNIAIGSGALVTNTSGSNNIALGTQSNFNGSGSRNITMGFDSGNNLGTGNDNIIIGNQAGNRDNLTSSQNVYIGSFAGGGTVNNGNPPYYEKTGNVFIGHNAGRYQTDSNRLFIENSDSNTPLLYGEFDNDILRANGTLQVGDPSGSGYAFPTNDGTNGQVMTTNGTGVVTFQDLPTYTDTDDQQIDTFNFNSSTNVLTLELEDDGQVAQTVDLSNLNPTKAVARILMSAGQTNTGAGTTKVNFDTRDFDIGGNFNLTNDNYVVPADGLYRVTAQVTADNSTGTGIFSVRIRVNGGQVRRAEFNHTGSGQVVRQVTSILNLTAGQTVDVAFSRPAVGATILANGGLTFFEIEQL